MKTMSSVGALVVVFGVVCIAPTPTMAVEVELQLTRGEAESLIEILADENVDLAASVLEMVSELIPEKSRFATKIAVKMAVVVGDVGARQFRRKLADNLGDYGVTINLSKRGIVFQSR